MNDDNSDIYVSEKEDEPSSSSVTVAIARKRPATPIVHAGRPSRLKRARRESTAQASTISGARTEARFLRIKPIGGERPPFNDKSLFINDPVNHRFFVLGGVRPDDEGEYPTQDFYLCDTITMKWTNLTDTLQTSANPFTRADLRPNRRRLPPISLPGCALVRIEDKSFIFIFGGFDAAAKEASSSIIVVDPDLLIWWYLSIEGMPVRPRIHAAVACVEDSVYIFGGYARFGDDCGPHNSYSILTYSAESGPLGTWRWTVRDRPYANLVPHNHAFGAAVPVYDGKKLILFPGRHTGDNQINFTSQNVFYYHVANERFQVATADFAGNFPQGLYWYEAAEFKNTPTPPFGRGKNPLSPPPKRSRGRVSNTSASASTSSTSTSSAGSQQFPSPSSPSVVICGWISVEDTDEIVPEIWHLLLSPDEQIKCLKISKHVWDLDRDFQGFVCAEGQLRIMGSDDNANNTNLSRWNVYVDIPV